MEKSAAKLPGRPLYITRKWIAEQVGDGTLLQRFMRSLGVHAVLAAALLPWGAPARGAQIDQARATTLFEEQFEDANFAARGWYDGPGVALSSVEHLPGSTKSAEFHWLRGAMTPASGGAFRRKFTASDSVYVSYWLKYSTNYTGSNKPYHPHEFLLMTTKNGDYAGPAYTHLTGYIEQNEGMPQLAIQDGQNIDERRIGQDLTTITENRSVAGCNGNNPDGYVSVDCYLAGKSHWNGKVWKAGQIYFQDTVGPYYKGDWHRIEVYFKLNSISDGKAVADGQLKYWYDDALIIDHSNVIMRTGANPDMKWNQFLIAPYIGDGSPVDQSMWVDNLLVATSRLLADTDGDGMPDDWEIANSLAPNDPTDAVEDADGDGFTNLEEYLAGTDPRSPNSVLRISTVTLDKNNSVINFNSVAGKTYDVERTGDLGTRAWSTVATNIAGTGGAVQITDPGAASQSKSFYRVKLSSSNAFSTCSGRARTVTLSVRFSQRMVPVESIRNSAGRAMSAPFGPPPLCRRS
jgi:Bacterial TSP3 repeat